MNPFILFENFYEDGTRSASSEAAGYPVANVQDWRTATPYRWKPTSTASGSWVKTDLGASGAKQPDTIIYGGHNLATALALVDVEHSDDNAAWTVAHTIAVPSTNAPVVAILPTTGAHRYWRTSLRTSGGGAHAVVPQLGVLTLGRRLEFPRLPLSVEPYSYEPVTDWAHNDGGSFLGANHRYVKRQFNVSFDDAGLGRDDFFQTTSPNWDTDFRAHAKNSPFWFAWNTDEDLAGVWLCRLDGGTREPFKGSIARRNLSVTFIAQEEAA